MCVCVLGSNAPLCLAPGLKLTIRRGSVLKVARQVFFYEPWTCLTLALGKQRGEAFFLVFWRRR